MQRYDNIRLYLFLVYSLLTSTNSGTVLMVRYLLDSYIRLPLTMDITQDYSGITEFQ